MLIKLKDANFRHNSTGTTSPFHGCNLIQWTRNLLDETKIIVYTDLCIPIAKRDPDEFYKVAWLLEPHVINHKIYEQDFSAFDLVCSHDKEFVSVTSNAVYVPFGTSWIKDEDWREYEKTKLLSIIASNKNYTQGQRLRHRVINNFKEQIDVFGYGYNPLENKIDGLRDYKFQIVIENGRIPGYFSEKIIDCFATHTIPIYWGDPNIANHFDPNGIIQFQNFDELKNILEYIDDSVYDKMLEFAKNNHKFAESFKTSENGLYKILEEIECVQQ